MRGNDSQAVEQRLLRQRSSDDYDDDDIEEISSIESELSRNEESTDSAKKSAQKTKRGRKMAMNTKDMDAMCTTSDDSSDAKIKKRNRRSGTNQDLQLQLDPMNDEGSIYGAASIAEEDEECSLISCIRPTGKIQTRYSFRSQW